MKKSNYIRPLAEVIELEELDIITASSISVPFSKDVMPGNDVDDGDPYKINDSEDYVKPQFDVNGDIIIP